MCNLAAVHCYKALLVVVNCLLCLKGVILILSFLGVFFSQNLKVATNETTT